MLSKLRMVFRTPVRSLALLLVLVAAFGVFAFALSMYTGIQTAVDEVDRNIFTLDDQNYHQVISGLIQLQQDAGLLLVIGLALFAVVILLFVHLSVRRRQHEAGMLLSLGTSSIDTAKGIAAPAMWLILIAVILSSLLVLASGMRIATNLLGPGQTLGLSAVFQGINPWLLIGLVAAEGVIAVLAVLFISYRISRKQPFALMRRVEE